MPAENGDWELLRRFDTVEAAQAYARHIEAQAPNYKTRLHQCGRKIAVEWRKVTYG